jgi:hypothetical protein
MRPNLLQPFQILTKLALHAVCQYLGILAIDNVPLSVQEPRRDFVLSWILDDRDDSFEFFRCDLTSATKSQHVGSPSYSYLKAPFVQVHISLLANQIGVASSNTLDLRQGVHDFLFAINVGVEETQDELEITLFRADESYFKGQSIAHDDEGLCAGGLVNVAKSIEESGEGER